MAGPKKKATHSLSETATTCTHLDTSSTDARPTKTLGQLHLWESHPRSEDGQSGHADQHHNMEEDASSHQSTLEEERQLQWLHRWFEESILEEPRAQRQENEWRGSSLLRALTKQKDTKVNGTIDATPSQKRTWIHHHWILRAIICRQYSVG